MAKKNDNNKGTYGERIVKIEANLENLVGVVNDIKTNHLVGIEAKLDKINEEFETRLPIWTTIVTALLSSGCIGLLVLYLSAIGKV